MNIVRNFITLYLFVLINCVSSESLLKDNGLNNLIPQKIPDTVHLAKRHGKTCEAFNVTTEDGYVLTIFHIPGNAEKPVLLMHGILESSDGFIERGNISMALALVNEGYDVWLGNNRGNRYSRRHVKYDPDTEKEFWNYSIHEMGIYDLPAIIDFILVKTGQKQLRAIGYSEGTTIFYILGSMKPEYNKKIKLMISLAPIAYIEHIKGLLRIVLDMAPALNELAKSLQFEELLGFNSIITAFFRTMCSTPVLGYEICAESLIFPALGYDPDNFEPEFLPTLVHHFPSGTSRRNLIHFAQIGLEKRFAQYDFGFENMEKYNASVPPLYDLNKVTMNVAMYLGQNDFLSTIQDVELLKSQLPHVVEYQLLEYDLWNHLDFINARQMPKYLFPFVLDLLDKYN